MQTYKVVYSASAPDWNSIEKAELSHALWKPRPEALQAWGQLCYNKDGVMVKLSARERDILARSEGLTDWVHIDSALEFFFCPLPDDSRYFNFEFNPKGTIYLGFGYSRDRHIRLLIPDYRDLFSIKPFRADTSWGIEFFIPASFISILMPAFKLEKGLSLRANFYKCGDDTKEPHYLAWSPIDCDHPEFHQSRDFGALNFE